MVAESRTTSSALIQFLLCCSYCCLCSFAAAFVGVYVNDYNSNKPPDPPLRDLFVDNISQFAHGFSVSDLSMIVLLLIWNLITIFHKDRFVLMKRYYVTVGTVYLFRTILVFSTTFPDTMGHECKPFINLEEIQAEKGTFLYAVQLFKLRTLFASRLFFSGGLTIVNGVLICGDYLFSGHTAMITTVSYMIHLPESYDPLKKLTYAINVAGMFGVLLAHEHYLVDVLVGYVYAALMCKYKHLQSKTPRPKTGFIPGFPFMEDPYNQYVINKYDSWSDIKSNLKNLFNEFFIRTQKQVNVIV